MGGLRTQHCQTAEECHKEITPESAISEETPQPAVVRLITAVWLPARLVRAHASNFPEDSVALFEPTGDQLQKRGLMIEEATTQPDNQEHITLIVRNNNLESVSLQGRRSPRLSAAGDTRTNL